jgi:N-acetylmuramoyl-L-alanine amidase
MNPSPVSTVVPARLIGEQWRHINLLVIHCSATASGKPIGQPHQSAATVIDAWHAKRGFRRTHPAALTHQPALKHIGYHWVIDVDGRVLCARHPREPGAHAAGFNAQSLGVCLVGGAERNAQYTPAQWTALRELAQAISSAYGIPLRQPTRTYSTGDHYTETDGICGHRDLSPDMNGNGLIEPHEWLKTCPGFAVSHWLKNGLVPDSSSIFKG